MQNIGATTGSAALGSKGASAIDIAQPVESLAPALLDSEAKAPRKSKPSLKKQEKIAQLLSFDAEMRRKWLRKPEAILLGTDEVGRGCLAGPVVAAAVQLPDISAGSELAAALISLNDSKKLSPQTREELAEVLVANCRFAIAQASVEEIEKINILQASFLAMRRAIRKLAVPESSVILVDGNQRIAKLDLRQIQVIGGDGISASIAAASVIAKVYRDTMMCRLHEEYPEYQWEGNKGYGSKDHRDAIVEHGLTPWHRKSFCSKILQEQMSLFD